MNMQIRVLRRIAIGVMKLHRSGLIPAWINNKVNNVCCDKCNAILNKSK